MQLNPSFSHISNIAIMEAKEIQIYPTLSHRRRPNGFQYKHYRKLVVSTIDGRQVICFDDILHICSSSNYCTIVLEDRKITLSKTLKWVQGRLDETFLRVHNSYLVSLLHISAYCSKNNTLVLSSGDVIPVSRSHKQELLDILK